MTETSQSTSIPAPMEGKKSRRWLQLVPWLITAACFAWMVLRLPREARLMVRRTLRTPRVAAALALALGGVAVAFGLVAFTPATDLAQVLPVAVVITVAARLAAFAALRGAARKHLTHAGGLVLLHPGDGAD